MTDDACPTPNLGPADRSPTSAERQRQIELLREGLWACYATAGGDRDSYAGHELGNEELVALVLDCVSDLRGLFDAARRDLRQLRRPG